MTASKKSKEEVLQGEIVPVEERGTTELDMLHKLAALSGGVSARTVEAWNILTTGIVPKEHLKSRKGYPDMIYYVDHVYATGLMNEAFRWNWDFEVLDTQLYPDGSTIAITRMTIHMPIGVNKITGEPIWKTRIITEVGAFEMYLRRDKKGEPILDPVTGDIQATMSASDRIASAASRGLVKCMERAFGIGAELKSEQRELTSLDAWNSLLAFGLARGLTRDDLIAIMKENEITKDNLLDRFQEAYTLVYEKTSNKGDKTVPLE